MGQSKHRISGYIDGELIDLIDKKVKDNVFRSRSHAIEFCVTQVLKEMTRG